MMEDSGMPDRFEATLEDGLVKVLCGAGLMGGGECMRTPDIDDKWDRELIEPYIADAVENINSYPEAALAWAGFLGMAVAHDWDSAWETLSKRTYDEYYGSRGWDDMDEHVLRDILGLPLDGDEAKAISSALDSCALATLGLIRHEGIETQTRSGFFVLARAYTVFFRLGASLELERLGYRKVRIAG